MKAGHEQPAAHGGESWPDYLPGLDLTAGLDRVGGNKNLFKRLLKNFINNHNGSTQEISAACKKGDFALAERLIHSIKGMAGNLAAFDLFKTLMTLESALQHRQKEKLPQLLAQMAAKWAVISATAQLIDPEESNQNAHSAIEDPQIDIDYLTPLLQGLYELLQQSNLEADRYVLSIKEHLRNSTYSGTITIIENYIFDLNFDGALKFLDDLAQELTISLVSNGDDRGKQKITDINR